MKAGSFRVRIASSSAASTGDAAVTAIVYPAGPAKLAKRESARPCTFVLAHGAGAGQRHPYIVGMAERLQARGVSVVTFDFLYTERGKKLPDKADSLESCLRAVFDAVRVKTEDDLFAGGKSMGGRIASQVAAKEGIAPAGLVFLGYPLHPPGKPDQRRDQHLSSVGAPMLFVQGTRDPFGTPDELAPVLSTLTKRKLSAQVLPVLGGDHSHAVPKRGGTSQEAVLASIADAIVRWMRER